jgi:hypothetical protein
MKEDEPRKERLKDRRGETREGDEQGLGKSSMRERLKKTWFRKLGLLLIKLWV